MTMRLLNKGVVCGVLLNLAACSVFSPVPYQDVTTYTLQAKAPKTIARKSSQQALWLTQVVAAPGLTSRAMAYSKANYQLNYYSKNRWVATPAQMLQNVMAQNLQQLHYFTAINTTPVGYADIKMDVYLRDFRQDFNGDQSVFKLAVYVQLTDLSQNRVLAGRNFVIDEPAPSADPKGGVIAANRAVADFLQQVDSFCVSTISIKPSMAKSRPAKS